MTRDLIFYTTTILFGLWLLRNTLFWLHLWQIKEYRFDRLRIHLFETVQGKNLVFGLGNLSKLVVFFIVGYFVFSSERSLGIDVVVFLVYLVTTVGIIIEIFNRKIKLPPITPKLVIIFLLTLIIEFSILSIHLLEKSYWIMVVDRLLPFVVGGLMSIFWLPAEFYKDYFVSKATKKRASLPKLKVIGITGSYGKGSTKEYLFSVLSEKFLVEKTFGTFNTPIGIARTILQRLTNKTEIFIAEMGAYKIGEVEEMCQLAQPSIGILTAVNSQHVSLFGSIQNTMKAKYEIITSLPKDGIGLFNGNNELVYKLYKHTKKRKAVLYYVDYENREDQAADIIARNIHVEKLSVNFDVKVKSSTKVTKMKVNLIGKQVIENILPGIFLGLHMGMNMREIHNALIKIKPSAKTMEPLKGERGSMYIDDTFNANPQAVLAALEYMKVYKGKKVLVLQPMIELGKSASDHHMEIARAASEVCDALLLTNNNFYDSIAKGIERSGNTCEVAIKSPREIAEFIKGNLKDGDVVVFEGKESKNSLELLKYEKAY